MRRTLAILLFASVALFADGPEFEVASIKPTPSNPNGFIVFGPQRGGPGTPDPTHINWASAALRNVVMAAFDVKNYQVAGPDDLDQLRFDFAVGIPEGATRDQVAVMWRNLLTSRFGLKYHIEQREFPVDQLVVGPKGHKLVENKDQPSDAASAKLPLDAPPPPGRFPLDKEGRPALDGPGLMMLMSAGPNGPSAKTTAKAQPISELVRMLSNQLEHPVVDNTGLTGKYDFSLDFQPTAGLAGGPLALMTRRDAAPAGAAPPASTAPAEMSLELPQALEQQLGLRLVKGKGMLDVIVVEKINRVPTEN